MLTILPAEFYVIVFSRFFAGIAHGLAYPTFISHLSENSSKWLRASNASIAFLSFTIGTIISTITFKSYADTNLSGIDPFRIIGGVGCILSAIAIFSIFKFHKQSIIELIQNRNDLKALKVMQELRGENFETTSIRDDFDDLRAMIRQDEMIDRNIFHDGNSKPLLMVILLKISFVLSFNHSLNMIRLRDIAFDTIELENFWIFIPRIIVAIIIVLTIENGRRIHYLTSSILISVTLLAIATIKVLLQSPSIVIDLILFIVYEISCSIGLGAVVYVYDAEAFRTSKKVKSIAFGSLLENILQIALILLPLFIKHIDYYDEIYLFLSAILLITITVYMFYRLPETSRVSISRTKDMFLTT